MNAIVSYLKSLTLVELANGMRLTGKMFARTEAWWEYGHMFAAVDTDPLIVAGNHGAGRSVAFASDCGPHWAPPPFVEWSGYARLWQQLVGWAAGQ